MTVALLAFAAVASGTGVSRAADSARGPLISGSGAPVAGSELRAIAFTPAGTSWAVGDALDHQTGGNQALIERQDGSGWTAVPSPYQSTMSNGLNSVSMTSGGGWAVGYALKPGWT